MALCIASLLLAVSPVFIAGQDFVIGSSSSGACIGSYCCDGSLIGGTGNSNDASDFTCCLGDPNHGIINGVADMTCSAGTAVPLTAATGSAAAAAVTGSATRTSTASNSASPTSDDFSDDDDNEDSSSSDANSSSSDSTATATASGSMSTSTSQGSSASSSSTPTSSTSESASASSESSSAGTTGNAAVGTYQLCAGHIAVGIVALGYNFAL